MPVTVRQPLEVTEFTGSGLHRGSIRANPSIRFHIAFKQIRRLSLVLGLGITLKVIIGIAVSVWESDWSGSVLDQNQRDRNNGCEIR